MTISARLKTQESISGARLLYRSAGGETWLLVKDEAGVPAIEHRSAAPGATADRLPVTAFLADRNPGPQQKELLRLIGTLVDSAAAGSETS